MADIARALNRVAWNYRVASRPSSSTSNISNPTFLTENDIPGASLLGRKPDQLKISELKFWHKYRGNAGIRLKTKAELVKRVHDYIRPWFLGRTRQKLLSYYFEHFIKFAYAKLFNWNCLKNKNSDCEVLWTATCFYIQIFLIVVNLLVDWELIPYMNKFLLFCSCNLLWVENFPTCLIFNLLCFKVR